MICGRRAGSGSGPTEFDMESPDSSSQQDAEMALRMEDEEEGAVTSAEGRPGAGCGKKDKLCLVCGDKALGYNFNAVTCESCKAFFRRNAHKTIRGRCMGKCDVTVESRSFCKKCRLAKCFTAGMRKDMILNEEQKKVRKRKILFNRLKRQGHLTPDDPCHASAENQVPLDDTALTLTSMSSVENGEVRLQETTLTSSVPNSCPSPGSPTAPLLGWGESQGLMVEAVGQLTPEQQRLVRELQFAMEASSFLGVTSTTMKSMPTNPTEFINMAEGFVRKVIKVAKNIASFKTLQKDDQVWLLKGSVVDIMMLRSLINYDPNTESWSLSTKDCLARRATISDSSSEREAVGSEGVPDTGAVSGPLAGVADTNHVSGIANSCTAPTTCSSAMLGVAHSSIARGMTSSTSFPGIVDMERVTSTSFTTCSSSFYSPSRISPCSSATFAQQQHASSLQAGSSLGQSLTCSPESSAARSPSGNFAVSSTSSGSSPLPVASSGPPGQGSVSSSEMSSSEAPSLASSSAPSRISAELLKRGSPEMMQLFMNYAKFVRSLMGCIQGDLLVLELLIMMSLFSADRTTLLDRERVQGLQEEYASVLQSYSKIRFAKDKSLFARLVMKLTDLRNINEVHTKMLLSMKINNLEPLLLEIFDL